MNAIRQLHRLGRLTTFTSRRFNSSIPDVRTVAPAPSGANHRSIMALDGHTIRPFIQPNAYIAPSASIIGSVTVNQYSSIWYNTVVRGDLSLIQIGAYSSIGENGVLKAGSVTRNGSQLSPAQAIATGLSIEAELFIGDFCSIGANVSLDSCTIRGHNVIGDGVSIGKGAFIGRYAVILPGSVVKEGVEIGEGEIWGGKELRKVGEVTDDERMMMQKEAEKGWAVAYEHMSEFLPVGTVYWEKEQLAKQTA